MNLSRRTYVTVEISDGSEIGGRPTQRKYEFAMRRKHAKGSPQPVGWFDVVTNWTVTLTYDLSRSGNLLGPPKISFNAGRETRVLANKVAKAVESAYYAANVEETLLEELKAHVVELDPGAGAYRLVRKPGDTDIMILARTAL